MLSTLLDDSCLWEVARFKWEPFWPRKIFLKKNGLALHNPGSYQWVDRYVDFSLYHRVTEKDLKSFFFCCKAYSVFMSQSRNQNFLRWPNAGTRWTTFKLSDLRLVYIKRINISDTVITCLFSSECIHTQLPLCPHRYLPVVYYVVIR